MADNFPDQCRYVLETLREVYKNDAVARERNLSPDERLRFHQAESGPLMKKLKEWFNQQFEDRLVEPSSGVGEAIPYMLKHWDKLTLFLREPGAPLDNNITERALKRAILHRKNALFYMSENGAHVGDLLMSARFERVTSKWNSWNRGPRARTLRTDRMSTPRARGCRRGGLRG